MKPVPPSSSWSRKFRRFFGHFGTRWTPYHHVSHRITSSSDSFRFENVDLLEQIRKDLSAENIVAYLALFSSICLTVWVVYYIISLPFVFTLRIHILRLILCHILGPYLKAKAAKASTCPPYFPFQLSSFPARVCTCNLCNLCNLEDLDVAHVEKTPALTDLQPAVQLTLRTQLILSLFLNIALENDESYGSRKLLSLKFMIVLVSSFAMCIPYL